MPASTIKIRVIGASANIAQLTTTLISRLSPDMELLDQSKVYPSRNDANEARVYLTFKVKEGVALGATEAVMGGK